MAADVESGRVVSVAKIKEWLTLASLVVVVLGGMLRRHETGSRAAA